MNNMKKDKAGPAVKRGRNPLPVGNQKITFSMRLSAAQLQFAIQRTNHGDIAKAKILSKMLDAGMAAMESAGE